MRRKGEGKRRGKRGGKGGREYGKARREGGGAVFAGWAVHQRADVRWARAPNRNALRAQTHNIRNTRNTRSHATHVTHANTHTRTHAHTQHMEHA